MVFDRLESVILPQGCPEQLEIRRIIQKAKDKLIMKRTRNIFELEAWVEELEDEANENIGEHRPFGR